MTRRSLLGKAGRGLAVGAAYNLLQCSSSPKARRHESKQTHRAGEKEGAHRR